MNTKDHAFKWLLDEMPLEYQRAVRKCAEEIRQDIAAAGEHGTVALCLVASEMGLT